MFWMLSLNAFSRPSSGKRATRQSKRKRKKAIMKVNSNSLEYRRKKERRGDSRSSMKCSTD